jgi:hypothetical protein
MFCLDDVWFFGYWRFSDIGYWMFAYQSTSDTKVLAAVLLNNCRTAEFLLLVFTKTENIYANIHQKGVSYIYFSKIFMPFIAIFTEQFCLFV